LDFCSPAPCGRGLGGGGSHFKQLVPDNLQDSLKAFNISCVISQFYHIFLKAITWFQGTFPHPLAPSRKGRGDFLEPLKMSKLQSHY
jgi:hypothetical protein